MFNPLETTQQPQPGNYNPNHAGFFQEFTDDLDAFETGSVKVSLACAIASDTFPVLLLGQLISHVLSARSSTNRMRLSWII